MINKHLYPSLRHDISKCFAEDPFDKYRNEILSSELGGDKFAENDFNRFCAPWTADVSRTGLYALINYIFYISYDIRLKYSFE